MAVAASVYFERLTSGLFFSSIVTNVVAREVCFSRRNTKEEEEKEQNKKMLKKIRMYF